MQQSHSTSRIIRRLRMCPCHESSLILHLRSVGALSDTAILPFCSVTFLFTVIPRPNDSCSLPAPTRLQSLLLSQMPLSAIRVQRRVRRGSGNSTMARLIV